MRISNLAFEGTQSDEYLNNEEGRSSMHIHTYNSQNTIIENIEINDGSDGIYISGGENTTIQNIKIKNTEHAITLSGETKDVIINNVSIQQYARDGTQGYLQTGFKIATNTKNIIINNTSVKGYFREAFRLTGVSNITFQTYTLMLKGNYEEETLASYNFNFIEAKNIK
jgi:hypothetical protein